MRTRRLSLTLLILMLGLSLAGISELARPASAVSNNSHVATTTSDRNVYQSSYQNPGFYAQGRYWVFYEDLPGVCEGQPGCFLFTSSTDGVSWRAPTNIGKHVTENDWSIVTDGTHAFYTRYNESSFDTDCNRALLYGTGSLATGGTIVWQPEQVVKSPSLTSAFPNDVISIDSNNQIWIGYQEHDRCGGGSQTPHVIRSDSLPLPPAPLSTGFTFSPANPIILQNVTFTADASGGASPYAFSWDFGDGSTGSGQTATHNYTGIGPFTVTLETTDSSGPQQTAVSSQTVLIGPTTNQSPSLQVPVSMSVWAATTVSFTVNATDTDGDTIALTLTGAPTGAAFSSSGAFVWRPTEDQAGKTWTLSFNATDSGSPALSVMKQVLVYVQPLWIDDTILQTSPNGNWHVNIATLPGGQVYAAYWIERHSMLGRLYGGGWGGEEQVSLSSTLTDVNSFIFASGNNLYAIYYDTSSESLYFASRSSNGAWIQSFIGFGEASSATSLHQYSLPFTASVNQADPTNPHFYLFWYNQTRQVIDEWSSTQSALGSQWLRTNATFSTQTAFIGYSISSFHYSAPVSGKNAFGLIWIDGASSPYSLNFGLETIGSLSTPTTDASWNPRVNCVASVVTIEQILGNQVSSLGGSVEGGSIYNPGIIAPGAGEAKRWLTPSPFTAQLPNWKSNGPTCNITNADGQVVSAFVEIRNVQRGFVVNEDYAVKFDLVNGGTNYPAGMNMSDSTFSIFTPGYGVCKLGNTTGCMHAIHSEIDHDWKAAGYCGTGTTCDVYPLAQGLASSQVNKTLIDVQGFIYWDPDHTGDASHNFSGWEIHPLTAWRKSNIPPSFSVAASPTALTTIPGKSVFSRISINSTNLFAASVSLTATVSPSGPTATLTNSTVTVSPCNQCLVSASTLNITTSPSNNGTYTITVIANGGGLTSQVIIRMLVGGFSISASPPTLNIPTSSSAQSIITLTSIGGFSGTVNLSHLLNGCACGIVTSLNASQVVLSANGSKNVLLTVSTSSQTGSAQITVTGTSVTTPPFSASTQISVNILDFILSSSQTSLTMYPASPNSTVIKLTSSNGFSGTVTVKATSTPAGLTQTLNVTSVSLQSGGTAFVSLRVNGTQSGIYTVTVNATSGSTFHLLMITVKVVDFSISSISSIQVNVGSTSTTSVNLTSLGGFAGTVSLSNSTSSSALHDALSAQVVSLSPGGSGSAILTVYGTSAGNYTVTITATSGPLRHSIIISVNLVDFQISAGPAAPASINVGSRGNATIIVTRVNGFTGTVALSISAPSGLICSLSPPRLSLPPSPATSVLSCSSSTANDYTVIVTGTNGTLSRSTNSILFHFVDFVLSSNIPSLSLLAGQTSQTASVHLTSSNGFVGTITLNVVVSPAGPSATPVLATLKLTPGSGNSTGLTINAGLVAGNYDLNITATNGVLTHWSILSLHVQDFSITSTSASINLNAGSNANSTVTLTSLNGLQASVALIAPVSPSGPTTSYSYNGISVTGLTLPAGGNNATILKISVPSSTPGGVYTINATGTFGTVTHFVLIRLSVNGRTTTTLNCSPTQIAIDQPSTCTATISASGSNPPTGTVSFVSNSTGAFTPSASCILTTVQGVTSCQITYTPSIAGHHVLDATYSGDSSHLAANGIATLTVGLRTTSTSVVCAASTGVGVVTTCTATVTDSSPPNQVTPQGTVNFVSNSTGTFDAGTRSCNLSPTLTNGIASCQITYTPLTVGNHMINGTFTGDPIHSGSQGSGLVSVGKDPTTVSISCNPGTINVNQGTSCTVTVTDTSALPTTPTGSVTFVTNSTGTFSPGASCNLTNGSTAGTATCLVSYTASVTGHYVISGSYSGDSTHSSSSGSSNVVTVSKASPSVTTSLLAATISVGGSASDSATLAGGFNPGGTVSYEFFAGSTCSGPSTAVGTPVTVTSGVVPNSASQTFNAAGLYSWNAIYSGDSNNNSAVSQCEPLTVNKASPTIATTLSSTTPVVGTAVSDSVTLSGFYQATGTVAYSVFANGGCTASGVAVSTVTVTGGSVPGSRPVLFNATGGYSFQAVYSGDSNNNGAASACEPLAVQKTSPTINTSLSSTSIQVGGSVTDSASLSNSFQASGTVTYNLFVGTSTCVGTSSTVSAVPVTGGAVPNSRSVVFNATNPGGYSFQAAYSGDANNNGATSPCEPLTVSPVSGDTITGSLSSSTIFVGNTVTDSAILGGTTPTAGGTVTYKDFSNGNCAPPATIVSIVTITNSNVPNSRSVTFNSTGSFSLIAVYSGDSNNAGAASLCQLLTVSRASPTVATTLSANTMPVGGSATDSAALTGGYKANGTLTYEFFTGSVCVGTAVVVGSPVTVVNGLVPNSISETFNAAGSYSWNAVYSGDANNNGATSPCEPLAVQKASPAITTSLSSTSPVVGTVATDSATLANSFSSSGTVTYNVFANGACTAQGTTASTVTVTNNIVPNSRAVAFNATGSYSFQAVYSGDSNNNGAASTCEPLTVQNASPSISTALSATAVTVGKSVSDSATLTGSFKAGGTVTYSLFVGSGTCAVAGSTVSIVTVTNGVVPSSRSVMFNATNSGGYSWNAVYSGDANNNPATPTCEALTVNPDPSAVLVTSLSSTRLVVGNAVFDSASLTGATPSAGGNVTYSDFADGNCALPGTIVSIVTVSNGIVPNSRAVTLNSTGSFSFTAVYSGDSNNAGTTSQCEPLTVQKANPTIATFLSASTITVGGSVSDSATLTGSYQAVGTVTYEFFGGLTCAGTALAAGPPVSVVNGTVPASASETFNAAGLYSWNAVYSGDSNNNGATSPCEPLTVNKASPSTTTSLSSTAPVVGLSVSDSAALTNGFNAGGSLVYSLFASSGCSGSGTVVSTVVVTGGSVPNSRPVVFNATGGYGFQAVYSGDANNNGAASSCESLAVQKTSPTINTSLSSTSIQVGGSVTDSASLSNSYQAGGTAGYSVFYDGACTGPGAAVSIVVLTGGTVQNSRAVTFNNTGTFSFQAIYSGDANNNGATSACEPLTVNPVGVTIDTSLSATTVAVGGSVFDSATLQGKTTTATGTVTYSDYANGNCAAPATAVSIVTVTNGVVPNSRSVTLNSTGSFSFIAVYSGDSNNNGATSSCELLTAQKSSPAITTTLESSTIAVGSIDADTSTLSGGYNAGGTVIYEFFNSSTCSGTATAAGTPVTVANGVVPSSASVAFNAAGSYGWNAVYSGDANNNGASSPCEPLTVQKASPTITTALSSSNPIVGAVVTDSAFLTNGFSAGGTVNYNVFTNGACSAPGTLLSTVTVTSGVVPVSSGESFGSTGSFSFSAVYTGDSNNNGAASPCEPLTVQKASPTITTSLSSSSILVGQSVTDSATLANSYQASGTVAYTLFNNGACTSPGITVSIVTVANGFAPVSKSVTFNSTASYGFQAFYSGDSDNNIATSPCEPLIVNPVTAVITTTLSSNTATVGASVHDSANLQGTTATAGGTVTYTDFANGNCVAPGTIVSIVTVTNGLVSNSRAVKFNSTGGFSFIADYSGDLNNKAATSTCEPLAVNKATPTLAASLSSASIVVGDTVYDSATLTNSFQATGTVTYTLFANSDCNNFGAVALLTVTVANNIVPNSQTLTINATSSYTLQAAYSGDANNNGATSTCEPLSVNKASPVITTTLLATIVAVGGSVSDTSLLANSFNPGGTVSYEFFAGSTCSGPSTAVGTPVTITSGAVPSSASQTFNAAGLYSWNAIYSGDSNNNGAVSQCEPLTVNKASPTIATSLSSSAPVVGTSVSDSATLTNGFNAGGSMVYSLFDNVGCTAPRTTVSTVAVTGGSASSSRPILFNATGSYSFQAVYSGDSNNNGATSSCEPLAVQKTSPTVNTSLSSTSIQVGGSVTDSASLSATYHGSGTVSYSLFTNGACTSPGSIVSTVTVTNGLIPASRNVVFNNTGSYSFNVAYSGDVDNNGATSGCEPLAVSPTGVTITTNLSSLSIIVGQSALDSASLSSETSSAGGTVTYTDFANGNCAAPGTVVSIVTVTNGLVPNSRSVIFNSTGSFSFNAFYSGDANNNGATSPCEPLTVNKASPTIASSLSSGTITVGGSVNDSSTMAGGYNPGGTASYEFFSGSACGGTATSVGTSVVVTNGVVPNSAAQIFSAAGSYSWNVVYSGDTNNNAVSSTCELLTVQKASPVVSTNLSTTTPIIGTSVIDSATLTGSFNAGGTVTYSTFTNGACNAPGTFVSIVTVVAGVIPNSRTVTLNSTGPYSFSAAYSGDSNNNGFTSTCEPLTVIRATPVVATSISPSSTVLVGATTIDQATLSGGFPSNGVTGTVTYRFFGPGDGACSTSATASLTVQVGTGNSVPSSSPLTITTAGQYSYSAAYNGDANDNAATSSCEPLSVNKTSPKITTNLSGTTIEVGKAATDSATLASTFNPSGTVTYSTFDNGACTGSGTIVSTVTVSSGVISNSRSVIFNSTGSYGFEAVYSGDTNNNPATAACEPLTVQSASPTIATKLFSTIVSVGNAVTDSATLTGGFSSGGTITYSVFFNGACNNPGNVVSMVSVINGVAPISGPVTFNSTGSYSWEAIYSGDANNNGASSPCEPLTVNKATSTLTTILSTSSITIGQSVTDSAKLTGTFQATGTVSYYFFSSSGTCSGSSTLVDAVTIGSGDTVPSTSIFFPPGTGSVSFGAVYGGDANNAQASSSCEPLTVFKATPAVALNLSTSTATAGQPITASASMSGGYPSTGLTGIVTYYYFGSGGICTGTPSIITTSSIGTGNTVPSAGPFTPAGVGTFSVNATYNGDANNNRASSPCEPLLVNKASPAISTVLSSTTVTVGGSVLDSAILTSGFQAGGSATFEFFSGDSCAGTPTTVGSSVSVTNGVIPNSALQQFNAAGPYSWSALYSGDANNNGAISGCEPLSVQKASPTIATNLSSTSIVVGNTVIDSSTLSGGFLAGGTVNYTVFSNGVCTAPGAVASVAQVTVGTAANSRPVVFNVTGIFGFQASYSGDANNNAAVSPCKTLAVQAATPTLSTLLSSTVIQADQSATDSATLAGSYKAGGTVTYSLFGNSLCSDAGTLVSRVSVTNGIVANSRSVVFNSTGSYSFQAAYSGDGNNAATTSGCEPMSVVPVGPTLATTLSANPIIVGSLVNDSASLHGTTSTPTGTVSYTDFANGNCAAAGTVVSIVTVTNGLVPNSRSVAFNSTGSFSFNAFYSGDANNNGATSPCEPLTVNKASPTISTSLSPTSITVSFSTKDSATLSGGYKASGIVTYESFAGSTCAGPSTTVGTPVTVTNGVVPNSASQTFSVAGSYSWNAIYNGDTNNNGATSTCELLTVNMASPTLTTSLSSTNPTVGTPVADSATLSGGFNAGGTAVM